MSFLHNHLRTRVFPMVSYGVATVAIIAGTILGFGNSFFGNMIRPFSSQARVGMENSRIISSLDINMYGIPTAEADAPVAAGDAGDAVVGGGDGYCSCGCGCGCGCY